MCDDEDEEIDMDLDVNVEEQFEDILEAFGRACVYCGAKNGRLVLDHTRLGLVESFGSA